jgi:ankyrin repeat protein
MLLDAGADPDAVNDRGETALMDAIRSHEPAIVEALLAEAVDVDHASRSGWQAVHFAAASRVDAEMLPRILAAGGEVEAEDAQGMTPLIHAAEEGRLAAVRLLDERGADLRAVDAQGRSALDLARDRRHWDVVRYLEERLSENALAGR